MRNGSIGLFKPAETVAYLGAESPVPGGVNFRAPIVKKKDAQKVSKVPPEKKKLLISEPQGDVRHTCHVGIDGTSFGILQADKKELAKALPPPFPTTNGDAKIPPRPAPRRNPTLPNAAPVSPGTPVRHISSEKNIFPVEDVSPPILYPRNRTLSPPPPPVLPPKPGTRSSALVIENKMVSPNSTMHRRTIAGDIAAEFRDRKEQLLNLPRDDSFFSGNTTTASSSSAASSNPEAMLDQVLSDLQQDITNFSMTSSRTNESLDFSDTRPLLNGSSTRREGEYDTADGVLTVMSDKEFEAFKKRASQERAKAAKDLEKQRSLDRKASKISLLKQELSEDKKPSLGQYCSKFETKSSQDEWSPEAQEAYKLLVQCGNRLKSTSPLPDRSSPRKSTPSSRSSTSTELTIISGTQYTRASAPPEEDLSERNYENRLRAPPPCVPPKPKMKQPIEARRIADYENQSEILKF